MKSHVVNPYRKQEKRNYNKRLEITFNGEDNLRPTIIENLIDSSPTAIQCTEIYASFLAGAGFEYNHDINLSDSWEKYTTNDLVHDVCEPLSRHEGVFVHVQYNALFEKESFKIVPYSLCRIGKPDSNNYVGKILVCETGWGKNYKKDKTKTFDTYNPDPEIILEQVERDGGWGNYKGQIFFFKFDKKYDYPKSKIEVAYTYADVENNLGLYYNSTVKRCFEDTSFIRHREFPSDADKTAFYENIEKLSGIENASSKLVVQDTWDDEGHGIGNFKFDTIKNNVKPDRYQHFETSSSNFIRKAFNIPPQLIEMIQGKLGNSSGDDFIKAQSIYNAHIAKKQAKLETFFAELFRNYKEQLPDNWKIKQYSLLDDGTINK